MFRKTLKTFAALCLSAATVAAFSAAASADVMDFEDGKFEGYVGMKTDDGGDFSELSVVDFNGSKQLRVDVQDCSLLPKVQFEINKIVGDDNMSKINKIEMDITIASKDGETPPGWIGGAIGTAGGDNSPAWDQTDYENGEYENPVTETFTIERKFLLPTKKFVDGTEGSIALLMRWASDVPYYMYIDNVKFLDKEGNELALFPDGGSAPAETPEEAPAETPASDAATDSTPTGNTAAGTFAAIAAVSAAAAVVSRKRK